MPNKGIERSLKVPENCTVYEGHARFVALHELRVGADTLAVEKIFINVGGRASTPKIADLDGVDYLTNSSMMDVDFLPRHLLVLGGSYIGLESGQIYRRFGSEATIVEIGQRLVSREDEVVSQAIAGLLEREGVNVRLNATCLSVAKSDSNIVMRLDCRDGGREVTGSHLLTATGCRPNTDDRGLEHAGVTLVARGFAPISRGSGRLATATDATRSRIRSGTNSRLWRQTSSTANAGW